MEWQCELWRCPPARDLSQTCYKLLVHCLCSKFTPAKLPAILTTTRRPNAMCRAQPRAWEEHHDGCFCKKFHKMLLLPAPVLEKVQDWQQSPPKGRSPDIEKWKTNLQWFVVSLVVSGKFGLTGIIATTKMNAPKSETCWGSSFDLRSLNILLKSPFFFSHKVLLCSLLILATDFSIKDSAPWSLLSYHVYFVLGDFTFSDTTWLRLHRSFFFSRAAASCPETNKYISLIVSQWCLNHIL